MSDLFFPCPHAGATRRKPVSVFPLPATPFPGRCSHAALVRPAHFHEAARGAGHGHKARTTAIQRIYCRAKTLLFSKNRHFFVFIGKTQRFFSLTLGLTSVRLSDIRERRALLKLAFTIKFSQNLNTQKGRVATTLTLRIYTIPKGRTIYLASVSGCCLSIYAGNARSLIVWMSKIQSSRFSHKTT